MARSRPGEGPRHRLAPLLLLAGGAGGAGAVAALLVRDPEGGRLLRTLLAPGDAPDPGIPVAWGRGGLAPAELQALGLERSVGALFLLALLVLAVGAGSAAFLAALEASAGRRERGVRGMVGAAPGRLLARGLVQALLPALGGAAAGGAIALLGAGLLLGSWPGDLVREPPGPALPLLLVAAGAGALLLAGFLPVLRVLRAGWLGDALAPHARTNPGLGEETVRTGLLAGQGLLVVTILYAGGLLVLAGGGGDEGAVTALPADAAERELVVVELEMGGDGSRPLLVDERGGRYRAFADEVRLLPEVAAAGLASRGALGGRGTLDRVMVPLAGDMLGFQAEHHAVEPEWFDTLGIAVAGEGPRGGGVVLNATAGRFAFWDGPGSEADPARSVRVGGRGGLGVRTVGLLPHDLPLAQSGWGRLYHLYRLLPFGQVTSPVPPVIYLSFEEHVPERAELLVGLAREVEGADARGTPGRAGTGRQAANNRPADDPELEAALRSAAARAGLVAAPPEAVVDRLHRFGAPGRWLGGVVSALGALALFLSLLGVSGIVRAVAERRVAELGLRRAIGGSRVRVVAGVLGELALSLGAAAWIGLGTAVAAGRALTDFLPWGPPFQPGLYLGAVMVLALAALLGAVGPLRRATSLPPARAIRRGEEVAGGGLA